MAANFLNTNRNETRYFFATTENGEQDIGLAFGTTGGTPNLSTMSVTLSGGGGSVVVNQAPQFVASQFVDGEQALIAGTDSTYFTISTLASTLTGVNISVDRQGGTGVACIESYAQNGSLGGFEFLSRGLNSELTSTNQVAINRYMSSIGRPGATGVLGPSGTLLVANAQAAVYTSLSSQPAANRVCYAISDLSGANGVTIQPRWTINTINTPTGGNVGSDFNLYGWADNGIGVSSALAIRRADQAMAIPNLSAITTQVSTGVFSQIYPTNKSNEEFQAGSNTVVTIAGSSSNQALFGNTYAPLFSTNLTNLNPNGKTFLSINWANALSTGSNLVTYKVGFSTATAYTNTVSTHPVPGLGGSFTPSGLPSSNTPIGNTLITCACDPDGVNPDGTGTLYVLAQFANPNEAADLLYLDKGPITEPTRYALTWHTM